jgi:hypothetical protein
MQLGAMFEQYVGQSVEAIELHICLDLYTFGVVLVHHAYTNIRGCSLDQVSVFRAADHSHHIDFVRVSAHFLKLDQFFAKTAFHLWQHIATNHDVTVHRKC